MSASKIPLDQLWYAKGTLSGLLNFSIRSGLVVGDGCLQCGANVPTIESSPAYRCRCGYEHALEVAIRCIDDEIAKKEASTPPSAEPYP